MSITSITYEYLYVSDPPLATMTASLPFQFNKEGIVQLWVNMKQLLINLSKVFTTRQPNQTVTSKICSLKQATENEGCVEVLTPKQPPVNDDLKHLKRIL